MITLTTHGVVVNLELPADDHITNVITKNGDWYEKAMLEDIYNRHLSGTAIDVGACFGTHSVWFAAVCGLDVIALEPLDANYQVVQRNIELNGLQEKIHAIPFAIGAKSGFVKLKQVIPGNRGSTAAVLTSSGVPMITLDDLDLKNVSLIKIDVEGMELDVLNGALKTIDVHRPMIYVESVSTYSPLCKLMEKYKYDQVGKWNATPTYGWMPR